MRRDGAGYMFLFAGAVCVVCAVFVASAAVVLKERQQINQALDKQQNVLFAAGLARPEEKLAREAIESRFNERVKPVVVDLESGEVVENPGFDISTYNADKAADDPQLGQPAPENMSSIQRMPKQTVVYQVLDAKGGVEMVVLPIKGYGLWSTLYGFLAVDRDGTTVRGITYYQHGETPGLGGEVDNPRWKALWDGRRIYGAGGEPELEVIKGQAGPPSSDPHRVDGLSGATITSRGVSNMIRFWTGEHGFQPYLDRLRKQAS